MATESSFVASNVSIEVEGDITVPGAPDEDEEPSTLDEPVLETLVSLLPSCVAVNIENTLCWFLLIFLSFVSVFYVS